jgi:hypothetical protein
MNKKLFNDNGGETPTIEGSLWSEMVIDALQPIVQRAVTEGVSLRDLSTVVITEIMNFTAEERLRRGIFDYRTNRKAFEQKHNKTNQKV